MQKVVTPAVSTAVLEHGYDRVAGFVVRAADVAFATTPAQLFVAHGLGFPATPFGPDAPHVDVLRFPAAAQLRFEDAVGGTDEASRRRTGGSFVDRPPFTGTGFVAVPDEVVPLYWLVHSRVPAGSELVRVHADGSSSVLARFADVGHGWVVEDAGSGRPGTPPLSRFVGPMALWHDEYVAADVLPDGTVVLATPPGRTPALDGFVTVAGGRGRREVARAEVEELFELDVSASWGPLQVRVVDQWTDADGEPRARVAYTGHDADLAEQLGLEKLDAAVYEATVPMGSLRDVTPARLVPESWGTATV
ncbi:hypothetical protein ACGIF2_10470 [Cellulomonas sp. P22]|uniref:hypothetical protein n=1 Tax=Cellulomonas sp. P22 TaxID=3373189 RepID=UPI0037BA926D